MLVENLSGTVRDLLERVRAEGSNPEKEAGFARMLELFEPYAAVSVDDFLTMLSKVKKPRPPKKTPEEIAREKEEKAQAKAAVKARKKEEAKANADAKKQEAAERKAQAKVEKDRAKAEDNARKQADKEAATKAKAEAKEKAKADKKAKAQEAKELAEAAKKAKKEADAKAKSEAKEKAASDKKAKAEADAQAKAAAKLQAAEEKKAKKAEEAQARKAAAEQAVLTLIDDLKALLMRFRGGNVPQEAVDEQLDKLKPLNAPQLLQVAQALNADATLTESSPKGKILKQVAEMVRRVWKTSDNVNN